MSKRLFSAREWPRAIHIHQISHTHYQNKTLAYHHIIGCVTQANEGREWPQLNLPHVRLHWAVLIMQAANTHHRALFFAHLITAQRHTNLCNKYLTDIICMYLGFMIIHEAVSQIHKIWDRCSNCPKAGFVINMEYNVTLNSFQNTAGNDDFELPIIRIH